MSALVIEKLSVESKVRLVQAGYLSVEQIENMTQVVNHHDLKRELKLMTHDEFKRLMEDPPAPVKMAPGCKKRGKSQI